MPKTILQPPGWPRPKGYSNGISTQGRLIFVAGTVGWNETEVFEHDDFAGQARQAPPMIVVRKEPPPKALVNSVTGKS